MATKNGNTGERLTAAERKRIKRALKHDGIPRGPLARALQQRIEQLKLSRNDAGKLVDDAPSQMSRLMTGHVDEFSADRLIKMLRALGVSIYVGVYVPTPQFDKRGKARKPRNAHIVIERLDVPIGARATRVVALSQATSLTQ